MAEMSPEMVQLLQLKLAQILSQVTGRPAEQLVIEFFFDVGLPGKTGMTVTGNPPLSTIEDAAVNTWLIAMNNALGGSPVIVKND